MKVDLDFTNVKASKKIKVPEGDYIVKVKKAEKTVSKAKNNMIVVDLMFMTGGEGVEGKVIQDNHVLNEKSLWTLRNMLEAMGYNVPAGKMKFSDKMILNKRVGITVIDGEEYKGRTPSEVVDYLPVAVVGNRVSADTDIDEDDDDDEIEDEDAEEGFLPDDDEDDEEPDEDEEDPDEDDDEENDSFSFDDDEEEDEDDEDEATLSFDADDVESAKAAELKAYFTEAKEAGWEFDMPKKAKASDVRSALLTLFAEDDDDGMEDFDLDDVE